MTLIMYLLHHIPLPLLVVFPLVLACCVRTDTARRRGWMLIAAPLPMLLAVLLWYAQGQPEFITEIPWLMLGLHWRFDNTLAPILLMTVLLWTVAGIYVWQQLRDNSADQQPHIARYIRCWLLTLSGNIGLLVAGDIASFYTLFALMTFAAFGLVIHTQTPNALFAGKVYILLAVIGEGLLLSGLIWGAAHAAAGELTPTAPLISSLPAAIAASANGVWIALLLFLGFGVKAGLAGLHWWLPLAHPVAPTPASAVLSGAMIKAGLVGWLLTLPLGDFAAGGNFANVASLAVILGLIGAFGAALMGVFAKKAKAVLAYSSVSQMGMITVMLGTGWLYDAAWEAILAAIVVFAVHHGFNKGVLFFGVGWVSALSGRAATLMLVFLLIPALNLIGVPFSSGEYAKDLFKHVIADLPVGLLYPIFSAGALATTALMARYFYLLRKH
ncbi:NADH-ubiquinone oxidoreductase [Aliidiomarina halalkaliphila]|uniref:NADH-ubiquinone oxidoreductase n=1 Tax=Aliidiomarina halalkaliphila TaxID=2593535 RepID=A0A552X5F1_9GAMM|nr:complex I subunit 5 family protein [Aliidiomarina halalkaliphila]TRW50244.1 NADH-ubiquinone oxidoreductase [Aliidiomarina halalkaliphila]